jgi:hypothetical protein
MHLIVSDILDSFALHALFADTSSSNACTLSSVNSSWELGSRLYARTTTWNLALRNSSRSWSSTFE